MHLFPKPAVDAKKLQEARAQPEHERGPPSPCTSRKRAGVACLGRVR